MIRIYIGLEKLLLRHRLSSLNPKKVRKLSFFLLFELDQLIKAQQIIPGKYLLQPLNSRLEPPTIFLYYLSHCIPFVHKTIDFQKLKEKTNFRDALISSRIEQPKTLSQRMVRASPKWGPEIGLEGIQPVQVQAS